MARFNFRLQKVLEARISFEDQAKRELGEAQRKLREERRNLEDFIRNADDFRSEMAERRRQGSTVQRFRDDLQQDWMNKRRISDQRHRLKKAEEWMEKKRQNLIQAMKERKVMEKLREKHLLQFKKAVRREELKFSDEVAGVRAAQQTDKYVGVNNG